MFQELGTVNVGSSVSTTLTYQFSGISATPVFSLAYAGEFALGSNSCSGSGSVTCSVTVSFSPRWAGSRRSALRATAAGSVLATTLLNGTGAGAQAVMNPGQIATYAGTAGFGSSGDGGQASAAEFADPVHFASDPAGNLFVADSISCTVREILAAGMITTVAGNGSCGFSGDGAVAKSAELNAPGGLAVDGAGNLYISDTGNNRIRRVDAVTQIISTIAGTGLITGSVGDGGPATSARLSSPAGLAIGADGTLYVADTGFSRIRKIATTGTITTVAGGGNGSGGIDGQGDGAAATNSILNGPLAVALDNSGNLFIADTSDHLVRKVTAGIISVVAGNGTPAFSGDGGPATQASISAPSGIWLDAGGWLYIADTGNSVVRSVSTAGVISTVAGTPLKAGYTGDGALATSAEIYAPEDVTLSGNGDLYILDRGNRVIRRVSRSTAGLTFSLTAEDAISTSQTTFISNIGNDPLDISALTFPNQFVQQSSGTTDCIASLVVESGSQCGVTVAFAPVQTGQAQGIAVISSNSISTGAGAGTISVAGTASAISAVAPVTGVSTLSFPAIALGSASSAQKISIRNASSVSLQLILWISGSNSTDFKADENTTTCGPSLAGGATCTVGIIFNPAVAGPRSAIITATEVGGGNQFTQSVFLSGSGTAVPPKFSNSTLNFGSDVIGTTTTLNATFSNRGATAVAITSIAFSAATPDFEETGTTCGTSLGANATCTVTVSFTPTVAGAQSATLAITDGAGDSIQPVTITGTGMAETVSQPPPTTSSGLRFVPVTPCRVVDTRGADGPFGGPFLAAGSSRSFAIPSGSCGIPGSAAAYALNVTVIPHGTLGYITVWPTGEAQPYVSNLNSWDGRVKANATIVPAGTSGAVSIFATNNTDIILDVSGYFVPAGSNAAALVFHPLTPCRVVDTRGAAGDLSGPTIATQGSRSFPVLSSSCNVPTDAQAYSLNFTVVPKGPLGYLSVWPTGQSQPVVSTLNSYNGTVVANAAIVPAGTAGDISVYASNETDVIIDINGYFGPSTDAGGLSLYNLTPCRVFDSRLPSGSPAYSGERTLNVTASSCTIPASAEAFVFNATAIPSGTLGFLGLWPNGEAQPNASTLNSWDGSVVSNLAIVPTVNGSIDTYFSDPSQLLLDIFGYFAP